MHAYLPNRPAAPAIAPAGQYYIFRCIALHLHTGHAARCVVMALCLLLAADIGFAQTKEQSAAAESMLAMAHAAELTHPLVALRISQKAEAYALRIADYTQATEAAKLAVNILKNQGEIDSSRMALRRMLAHAAKGDKLTLFRANLEASMWFSTRNQQDSVAWYVLHASTLASAITDLEARADLENRLGNFYVWERNYPLAIAALKQSLAINRQIKGKSLAGILSDLGNAYYYARQLENAMATYRLAVENAQAHGDTFGVAYSSSNLGMVLVQNNRAEQALPLLQNAFAIYRARSNQEGLANTGVLLANALWHLKRYDEGLPIAEEALRNTNRLQCLPEKFNCLRVLAVLNREKGNDKKALAYYNDMSRIADTIIVQNMRVDVSNVIAKFATQQTDRENRMLRERNKAQTTQMHRERDRLYFLIGLFLVASLAALWVVRVSRQRKLSLQKLAAQTLQLDEQNTRLTTLNAEVEQQKAALERAGQFRDKLFSAVSHDFRAPLASFSSLIGLYEAGLPPEQLQPMSQGLSTRIAVTLEFIDNLLAWSRSQMDGYQPQPTDVHLFALAESLIEFFRAQAETKHLHLHHSVPNGLHALLDAEMVRLTLRNFIANAIKFTPEGGQIAVHVVAEQTSITLAVTDTGLGMDEATLQKLRTRQITTQLGTKNEKGWGLGLELAQTFVGQNGGTLHIESTLGQGSTFAFTVPVPQPPSFLHDARHQNSLPRA